MSIAKSAKELYESEFRSELEAKHIGEYVAIEPESQNYFVADSFVAAAMAAKKAYPDRMPFVIRVGHDAAVHIGSANLSTVSSITAIAH